MPFDILLTGLAGVLMAGAPIVIAVIGETITERSGVVNLSLKWRHSAFGYGWFLGCGCQ
jgi:ABC-type uncharacterized transport system permease subunit